MEKPNIILIMTDQQRADTIHAMGYDYMITPNIDRLAREGTAYSNAFVAAPSCVPSRASFFNGQYPISLSPHYHTAWEHSWVEALQRDGYHTVNVGKMHTLPLDAPCGFDQRFIVENKDRPLYLDREHGDYYDELNKFCEHSGVVRPTRETYKESYPGYETALGAYEWDMDEKYHSDIFVGNMARRFIERRRSSAPLFLQIGFPGPHPPYDPPRRFIDMYRDASFPIPSFTEEEEKLQTRSHQMGRQAMIDQNHDCIRFSTHPAEEDLQRLWRYYAANVTLIDEQIGLVMEALERKGYLANSIVIFTSDHGDALGDHGMIQKWCMYDCVTKAPMVIRAPGYFPAGRVNDCLIQQMDVSATVLDMIGLKAAGGRHARSMKDCLEAGREFVYSEHMGNDTMYNGAISFTMIRSKAHKLVYYAGESCGELYDLVRDPGEKRNVWDEAAYAETKHELIRLLLDWKCTEFLYN